MQSKYSETFGLSLKMSFLYKNCSIYFLGNLWATLGNFFFQHLVTLTDRPYLKFCYFFTQLHTLFQNVLQCILTLKLYFKCSKHLLLDFWMRQAKFQGDFISKITLASTFFQNFRKIFSILNCSKVVQKYYFCSRHIGKGKLARLHTIIRSILSVQVVQYAMEYQKMHTRCCYSLL